MRRSIRQAFFPLLALLATAWLLGGCSSGGGTSGGNVSGGGVTGARSTSAGVDLSLEAATSSADALAALAAFPPDPDFVSPTARNEKWGCGVKHVYMDVARISLLPEREKFDCGDLEGELRGTGDGEAEHGEDRSGWVTLAPAGPTRIDLLALGNGRKLARFLDRFDAIPAGRYDKIRVEYDNVTVVLDDRDEENVRFHPTAHSRFDIHFREGYELDVPVTTDTTQPDGWVRFYRVKIDVVGLKIKVIDKDKGRHERVKVILRPQVFARAVKEPAYGVAGTADRVSVVSLPGTVSGTFDVRYALATSAPRTVPASFDNGSSWRYSDDVLAGSVRTVNVANSLVPGAFRNGAEVEVIGTFSGGVLRGSDVTFTFPDAVSGTVDNGWLADNTLLLRDWVASFPTTLPDNSLLPLFPMPDRFTTYYDNGVSPYPPLTDLAIDNNVFLSKARGYALPGGFEAFWLTVGP